MHKQNNDSYILIINLNINNESLLIINVSIMICWLSLLYIKLPEKHHKISFQTWKAVFSGHMLTSKMQPEQVIRGDFAQSLREDTNH